MRKVRVMDKYASLTSKERAGGGNPPRPPEDDDWQIVMPLPLDAPRAPDAHPKLGKPWARWHYTDKDGDLLFSVCRWNKAEGGKIFLPVSLWRHRSGKMEWRWKGVPAPRPLYGLDKLAAWPDAPVIVTEGEKSADAAARVFPDYVATTSPVGCKAEAKADWTPLAGVERNIWAPQQALSLASNVPS
jgi:putative DNA primase/helicase